MVALVAVQLFLGATVARGGIVSVRALPELQGEQVLAFDAAPGERNRLEIMKVGSLSTPPGLNVWQISDAGAPITTSAACTAIDAHTVRCEMPLGIYLYQARLKLGDQDDSMTVTRQAPDFFWHGVAADGEAGNDVLQGGENADDLRGGGGRDELSGNGGDDVLVDGDQDAATDERAPAADRLAGGPGVDLVSYHSRTSPVSVDLADPDPDGAPGEHDVVTGVESVVGGRGRDRLAGDEGPNVIDGGGGRDRLFGRGGDDELAFRAGSLSCGPGADAVNDNHDSHIGRLARPRRRREVGYVQPDCETFQPDDFFTPLPAYPARLRRSWVGYRVSCNLGLSGDAIACSGAVELSETFGRHRRLGSRSFPRGRWEGHLVRVRLTSLGRRLAARRHGVRATIRIIGAPIGSPLRWTIQLKVPR